MKTGPIEALFVDAAGTLIVPSRPPGALYAQLASEFGIEAAPDEAHRRFLEAFARARAEARARGRLAYGTTVPEARAFWRRIVGEALAPWARDEQTVDAAFDAIWKAFGGAAAWSIPGDAQRLLAEARRRGVPVVVVSNFDARLPSILDALGVRGALHDVVASFSVGAEKPDRAIFEAALATLPHPVRAEAVLHVGDRPDEDVAGARAAGLQAILLDRRTSAPRRGTIARLDELIPRLSAA